MSPHFHNAAHYFFSAAGFACGSVLVGGSLILAATRYGGESTAMLATFGGLVGTASAIAGCLLTGRWFRRNVPARCPLCSGRAYADQEDREYFFRCENCGRLDSPVFRVGR